MLLILMSGDISTNRGPRTIKYPCGVCKKAVRWNQDAVKCDQCDTWYHSTCMQINPITYQYLANHSETTWICCQCGMPSFSKCNTTPVELSNSFTSLNSNSASPTPVNPPNPVHTSTPDGPNRTTKRTCKTAFNRPLCILTINFQSCKNKVQELEHLASKLSQARRYHRDRNLTKLLNSHKRYFQTRAGVQCLQERPTTPIIWVGGGGGGGNCNTKQPHQF